MLTRIAMGIIAAAAVPLADAQASQPSVGIELQGEIQNPGFLQLPTGSRLSDALLAAKASPNAYLIGGMFAREKARNDQLRLKAGILHGLKTLSTSSDQDIKSAALSVQAQLEDLPVTGRVKVTLNARLQQIQPKNDPELASGDKLVLDRRPTTVSVLGAVIGQCVLSHSALKSARSYSAECPSLAAADKEYLYVIQADGLVQKVAVALWNRDDPITLSPGGAIFVPIRGKALRDVDSGLNDEIAEFIATQHVSP